jgi:RIO kinase 1
MEDEDSGHAQREDEEEAFEQQQQVTADEAGSDATALDADFAMALALQAEFAEKDTRGPAPSPYRKEPNEKVTFVSRAHTERNNWAYLDKDDDSDEEDDDYDDYDSDYQERYNNPHAPSSYNGLPSKPHHQAGKDHRKPAKAITTKHDPTMAALANASKMERYVEAGDMNGVLVANAAFNSLKKDSAKYNTESNRKRTNVKDRSATDSVLDAATRMSLFKMLNSGMLDELNGVVSCGKEAHVYHCVGGDLKDVEGINKGEEYVVKIYNMDMSHGRFRDRAKYVDGEFRYRHTATQTSGKAIKVWAEKELRNLKRITNVGIPCPRPVVLRKNILLMTFIGKDGVPAPRLKDAKLSDEKLREMYMQCILAMRLLYQEGQLVHADLSEYNILYYRSKLYFIDVSQAIESDHENALTFLQRDCEVMTKFFTREGVENAMSTQELFNFITDRSITPDNIDAYLDEVQQRASSDQQPTYEEQLQAGVFSKMFIPRCLSDVTNPAKEIDAVRGGRPLLHGAVTGLRSDLSGTNTVPEILKDRPNC